MASTETALITRTSSGVGLETAKYFANQGCQVAATLRNPDKDNELRHLPHVKLYAMDVNHTQQVEAAVQETIKDFSKIDVLINNACYTTLGVFESATPQQI